MIGEFGEVYLVDWGIAMRLDEPPSATTAAVILVGTPAYMAPEMVCADFGPLSPRTVRLMAP